MSSNANATFRGHYYDGLTALSRRVIVRLSTNMLVISDADGVVTNWTYVGLTAPEPVSARKTTRLAHEEAKSARLVVEDPLFVPGVLSRAPQLSRAAAHKRSLVIASLCFLVALAMLATGYVVVSVAPQFVARLMPDSWRTSLGEQVEQQMVAGTPQCSTPEGLEAIAALEDRLSVGAALEETFTIKVYAFDFINAFALPGGTIVLSGELLQTQSSADAIAGVLAHEFGHILERDSETTLVRLLGISAITEAAFAGSSQMGSLVGDAAAFLTLMSYSRDAERRADEHAVELLEQAQIDYAGLLSFFEYVNETEDGAEESTLTALASSHPGLSERIESLKQVEPWPSHPALDEEQWAALQAICND